MSSLPSTVEKRNGDHNRGALRWWRSRLTKATCVAFVLAGVVLAVVLVVERTTQQHQHSLPKQEGSSHNNAEAIVVATKPSSTPPPTKAQPHVVVKPTKKPTPKVTTPHAPTKPTNAGSPHAPPTPLKKNTTKYTVGSIQGIGYYHCPASNKAKKVIDVVLLHGASFTKEIWKTTGVLDLMCAIPQFSTTALDAPIWYGHVQLQNILNQLKSKAMVTLPLALVTPSASSQTLAEWMINASTDGMAPRYLNTWIPVAPGAITKATDTQVVATLRPAHQTPVKVLAIYGNRDNGGRALSLRLKQLVGATVVEIEGGHACYRQSPGTFVNTIAKFFGVQ